MRTLAFSITNASISLYSTPFFAAIPFKSSPKTPKPIWVGKKGRRREWKIERCDWRSAHWKCKWRRMKWRAVELDAWKKPNYMVPLLINTCSRSHSFFWLGLFNPNYTLQRSHLFLFAGSLGPYHVDVRLGELFVEELGVLHEFCEHRVGHGGLQRSKHVAWRAERWTRDCLEGEEGFLFSCSFKQTVARRGKNVLNIQRITNKTKQAISQACAVTWR